MEDEDMMSKGELKFRDFMQMFLIFSALIIGISAFGNDLASHFGKSFDIGGLEASEQIDESFSGLQGTFNSTISETTGGALQLALNTVKGVTEFFKASLSILMNMPLTILKSIGIFATEIGVPAQYVNIFITFFMVAVFAIIVGYIINRRT